MSGLKPVLNDSLNLKAFIKNDLRVGFIGGGNIAQAIIKGLLKAGIVDRSHILVSAPTDRNREKIEELEIEFVNDNQHVVDYSNVIILAMKPYQCKDVVSTLQNLNIEKMVLSTLAGVSMQSHLDFGLSQCIFTRFMPSLPISVCAGVCAYCFAPHLDNITPHEELLLMMFQDIAVVERVNDSQIDLVAALGSGPAYICEAIQGMTYGMVKMGLPLHFAQKLTPQVAAGTAKMIIESGKHPAQIIDSICSPGGTTITGLHAANRSGLRSAMMDAMEAAVLRARQMAEENKS